jgi:hypothetical protein
MITFTNANSCTFAPMKLFMIMLGCKPKGRHTEQHDIFFGIGNSLAELIPQMNSFWPEAESQIHIDAWREVNFVDGYKIEVIEKGISAKNQPTLFFINLGGYKKNDFEEYHYKVLAVAKTLAQAGKKSKDNAFYKHCGFRGAESHIDDKYGVAVDDLYKVEDILPGGLKQNYSLKITASESDKSQDKLNIGYLMLSKLIK